MPAEMDHNEAAVREHLQLAHVELVKAEAHLSHEPDGEVIGNVQEALMQVVQTVERMAAKFMQHRPQGAAGRSEAPRRLTPEIKIPLR
jgi:hypothetical protein